MVNIGRRNFVKISGGIGLAAAVPFVSSTSAASYDAIVVGAGLSGLHAAMLLEEAGLKVLVLEGRSRIGGRVYTLMDVPNKPEAAGELIGANYARMIAAARKLNLELYSPSSSDGGSGGWAYNIKNQFFGADQWESHSLNPMSGDNRKILPNQMLFTLSNQDNPLRGHGLDAWLTDDFARYDIPFDQYLRARGFSEETIRLMNVTIHTSDIGNTSALHELRRYHVGEFNSNLNTFGDGSAFKQIKGGNSLLPFAMAESLANPPLLNKTVVHFEQTPTSVTVHCSDGSSYSAGNVVCSIPIAVLRNVTFAPHMPRLLRSAVDEMDYGVSVQAHFLIKKRYWEEDGMPARLWTDGPLERFVAIGTGPDDEQTTGIAFINGEQAYRYNLMTDSDVFRYIEKLLVDMRPSMAGALEPLVIQSCERDIHGAGDWIYWQPGQVGKYGRHLRDRHGRIHFCGEHTAIMERGMEAAFESGERAAMDVLLT